MKLFRAIAKDEMILSSFNIKSYIDLDKICLLNEIYSHTLRTHRLKENRFIYSFTDDIEVACSYRKKYPNRYDRIGYFEINLSALSSALIENDENIILVKPIFRLQDWIDLIAYDFNINSTSITVKNTNYQRKDITLINTLAPSRTGALSYARTDREYSVICHNLNLKLLSEESIDFEKINKKLIDYKIPISKIKNTDQRDKVIEVLKKDLYNSNINENGKKILLEELNEYKQNM